MKLKWDEVGERLYETGLSQGVLYLRDETGQYPSGVPWNGLISVSENPGGAEPTPFYADNIKYLNLMSEEEFEASIESYTYPEEFEKCDGSAEIAPGVLIGQQNRQAFGLVYKTNIGNDVDGNSLGYKLHLIYNALASPSDKSYATIGDSPEPITFTHELSTTPIPFTGYKPTATITINSTKVDATQLAALEAELFGVDEVEETTEGAGDGTSAIVAHLPLPDEVATFFEDDDGQAAG